MAAIHDVLTDGIVLKEVVEMLIVAPGRVDERLDFASKDLANRGEAFPNAWAQPSVQLQYGCLLRGEVRSGFIHLEEVEHPLAFEFLPVNLVAGNLAVDHGWIHVGLSDAEADGQSPLGADLVSETGWALRVVPV